MINIVAQSGRPVYGLMKYFIDTENEVAELPKDRQPGSTALVKESGNTYMLDSQGVWNLLKNSSGGSSGTGDIYESLTNEEIDTIFDN